MRAGESAWGYRTGMAKGYSGDDDHARLVHVFHCMAGAIDVNVWLEHVASGANIADLPSRGAYQEYYNLVPGSIGVPFMLPEFSSFVGPLQELLQAFDNMIF